MHIEKIESDEDFWYNTMLPKLKKIYLECVAPEIILNRRSKGLKCRDLPFIENAIKKDK